MDKNSGKNRFVAGGAGTGKGINVVHCELLGWVQLRLQPVTSVWG